MGLLDGLLGQVTGALGGSAGQQQGLVGSVLDSLTSGQQGGLAGLIQSMEQQGLGNIARSWVSTGQNLPITPEQIQQVLGNARLQQFASQHGIDVNQVAQHLSQILPVAVDKLTPNGTLPDSGGLAGMLKGLVGGTGA